MGSELQHTLWRMFSFPPEIDRIDRMRNVISFGEQIFDSGPVGLKDMEHPSNRKQFKMIVQIIWFLLSECIHCKNCMKRKVYMTRSRLIEVCNYSRSGVHGLKINAAGRIKDDFVLKSQKSYMYVHMYGVNGGRRRLSVP